MNRYLFRVLETDERYITRKSAVSEYIKEHKELKMTIDHIYGFVLLEDKRGLDIVIDRTIGYEGYTSPTVRAPEEHPFWLSHPWDD